MQEVKITKIDISFRDLVNLQVKWIIALIPSLLILGLFAGGILAAFNLLR